MAAVPSGSKDPETESLERHSNVLRPDVRAEMVEAARKFMLTPKVRQTSLEEQKSFLFKKGVSEAEFEEARRRLASVNAEPDSWFLNSGPGATYGGASTATAAASTGTSFMSVLNAAVSIGCVSYVGYRFVRSWLLPRFFDIPDPADDEHRQLQNQMNDLQNSMKFVMDSTVQTLQKVEEQQENLNRAISLLSSKEGRVDLNQLQTDISVVKSLLLTPTIPLNGAKDRVPAWQRRSLEVKTDDKEKSPVALSSNGDSMKSNASSEIN